jgi:tetratricopeptide (TPR) repeat protein
MDTLDAFSVYLEAGVHQAAAEALSLQNREADAVAEYSKAIELDSDSVEAYYGRAMAYEALGEFECAVEDYTESIRLDPDYPEAYSCRAKAYYMLMQEDIALTKEVAQRTVRRAIARGDNTDAFPSYVRGLSAYLYQLERGAFKRETEPNMSTEPYVFYVCDEAFFIER